MRGWRASKLDEDDPRLDGLSEADLVGHEDPAVGVIDQLQCRLELVLEQSRPRCQVGVDGRWRAAG